jgi:2-oxoglutarate ferredoxin oxidoreductase subunit beta
MSEELERKSSNGLKGPVHKPIEHRHEHIEDHTPMHIPEHSHGDEHDMHPSDLYLKEGRIPHIWCPGCGLGIVLTAFIKAVEESKLNKDKVTVVSGIGCTGRIAGYLNLDTYHTTHGRALPFATGVKLANKDLTVNVISGDGDLFAIGGNHFIHAARRNMDLKILCVNNFNYGMTGGQVAPTTPVLAKTTTTPYGNVEHPFNLPYVAAASGAVYVARWTTIHARQLTEAIIETFNKKGFTFIEVISPCPTGYGRPNKIGSGLDEMKYYKDKTVIRHGIDPVKTYIDIGGPIIVGKFIDINKPTFLDSYGDLVNKVRAVRKG